MEETIRAMLKAQGEVRELRHMLHLAEHELMSAEARMVVKLVENNMEYYCQVKPRYMRSLAQRVETIE